MLSTTLEAVYLSASFVCYCLPVFDEIGRMAVNFVFSSILALPEYQYCETYCMVA